MFRRNRKCFFFKIWEPVYIGGTFVLPNSLNTLESGYVVSEKCDSCWSFLHVV